MNTGIADLSAHRTHPVHLERTVLPAVSVIGATEYDSTFGGPATISHEFQFAAIIAIAILGLVFGSFLNVVVTRLPEDESIAFPGSHCRNCDHTLAWWENIPVLSWIALRGRCRICRSRISIQYPFIELTIAVLWVAVLVKYGHLLLDGPELSGIAGVPLGHALTLLFGKLVLSWLLVALAVLDTENLWLPDVLTIPGIALGLSFSLLSAWSYQTRSVSSSHHAAGPYRQLIELLWARLLEALIAAAMILLIRLAYWLVRRREGMGLGDAKLMGMLGAWLGLLGAVESFAIAIFSATAAALVWLTVMAARRKSDEWAKSPLPLGTFLCLGALSEIFWPGWMWTWWSKTFLFL